MAAADPFDAWVVRDENAKAIAGDLPLSGLCFGVKDIIDVAGFPTAYGVDFASRMPEVDAWCVAALRAAGAVPVGKTRTTPFAYRDPAPTRNPRNPAHTPGGSSAGSGAAVAAGEVPLALGTQTQGSILRPAAYCGVVGFKPSWGRIPTNGVAAFAPSLDTVGFLAAGVALARRASEALFDLPSPTRGRPRIGFALDFMRERVAETTRAAIRRALETAGKAGIELLEVALPPCFEESAQRAPLVQAFEAWYALGAWIGNKPLPPFLAKGLAEGRATPHAAYRAALRWREECRPQVAASFENLEAIVVPAADPAPLLGTTGDPAPLAPATFFGLPALALPLGEAGPGGLPFAMQIVGPAGGDGAVLAAAERLEAALKP